LLGENLFQGEVITGSYNLRGNNLLSLFQTLTFLKYIDMLNLTLIVTSIKLVLGNG